ncbi:hypothetical protein GQ602_002861 [Ophiocordyceps camponoti-floridani]|uniref:Uncharacterized protein n=1 Tax=Ophiocordyceps camponoti-floridani TaxID=2030778 RepID=A0A8H4QBA2_9HYPO|nr:hypothetical protein GQ602_002861 [Ophiocordyceps camponoti-floridani]
MPESISSTSSGASSSSSASTASASSSSPTSPTGSSHAQNFHLGDNKAIRFQIRTGNQKWTCTLQDRASYERVKATRTNSVDSSASSTSNSSTTSL